MNKFVSEAIDQANQSSERYRLGAVMFKGGKIYSKGHNAMCAHAEARCLLSGRSKLHGFRQEQH